MDKVDRARAGVGEVAEVQLGWVRAELYETVRDKVQVDTENGKMFSCSK
jgi:hypothetical protein